MGTSSGVGEEDGILSIWHLICLLAILMFMPVSHLTELPMEILEQICLYLPDQDIIKMDVVWGGVVNSMW